MVELDIYLKSGQVVPLKVKEFSMTKNGLGDLNSWTGTWIEGEQRVMWLPIEEIACVIQKNITITTAEVVS